jgi:hypothetical protein
LSWTNWQDLNGRSPAPSTMASIDLRSFLARLLSAASPGSSIERYYQ